MNYFDGSGSSLGLPSGSGTSVTISDAYKKWKVKSISPLYSGGGFDIDLWGVPTITFDTAGGSSAPADITEDYNTDITAQKDAVLASPPTRDGFIFSGWTPEIPKNMPAVNTTVTATWMAKTAITPTVTITGWNYGDTAITPTTGGNLGCGTETITYYSTDLTTYPASTTPPTLPGSYTVKYSVDESATHKSGSATANFTIGQRSLSIDNVSKVYDGTTAAPSDMDDVVFSKIYGTDNVSLTSVSGSFASADAGSPSFNVTSAVLGGADKEKYTVSAGAVSGVIKKRPLTVKAKDQTVVKDTDISHEADQYSLSGGTLAPGHTIEVTLVPSSTASITDSGTITPTAVIKSGTTNVTANYDLTLTGGTLTITSAIYNLTYDLDGGTVAAANPATYTSESAAITLNNPTRTGYTFKGWSGTELTGDDNTAVTIAAGSAGDRSYTAHWTLNQYTITFDTDGGSPVAPITQGYGTAVSAPADPVKDGYTFAGWDKAIPAVMPLGGMTVKALWTPTAAATTTTAATDPSVPTIPSYIPVTTTAATTTAVVTTTTAATTEKEDAENTEVDSDDDTTTLVNDDEYDEDDIDANDDEGEPGYYLDIRSITPTDELINRVSKAAEAVGKECSTELFWDIRLFRTVDGEITEQIYEADEPVLVSIKLPGSIKAAIDDYSDSFSIVRLHNDKS